jgi:exonuclease SbcD
LVLGQLGDERSHEGVLRAAMERIDADRRARSAIRSVVMAHAFVVGGARSDASERSITVGGVDSVSADIFAATSYVALGHLHRPQTITAETPIVYSGAPLAYSFDEADQVKSVALVDINAAGGVEVRRIATPIRRALRQVSGTLDELLARASTDLADLTDAYVKVVLTDPVRPRTPMDRLQQVWPHTVAIEFAPLGAPDRHADLAELAALTSPVDICCSFVRFRTGQDPTAADRNLLIAAVEEATAAR